MRLYLASTSPARLATLRSAGIEPAGLINPGVDEEALVAGREEERGAPLSAAEMVAELARAKAEAVIGSLVDGEPIDGFILGGDSAFELDGVIYGKPYTADIARERWARMIGRTGVLHSGHWLIDHRGGTASGGIGQVEDATVEFAADISDAEIEAYIATGEPLAVAGAFTIDSRGQAFISRISGQPSTVIGLSVPTLRALLGTGFGVEWHRLWNR
ncbi:Maf family protein [Salinibacterium hongtaonis]|uniref:Nucleoside triphosphate pyrophosphatase n=1 Tax=Homoserinimonas hongtaonis TaxID=2079791 RepID=A0A2U1SWK4_9MICO|nr:nucleoside triphosphate pyrophosphatase [Salinibacterium hongtaonis]PWB96000.1 septum formation protein Maf [Salinibacterium hongtaonis]